jgi:hypothetical protein
MMKRIIPPALIATGFLLSFGAVSLLFFNNPRSSLPAVDLPEQIAGVSLTDSQEGTDAIAAISDLHGQAFLVDYGAVGIYGDHRMRLWVAGAASDSVAAQMTAAMQQKIAEVSSPFTPVEEIDVGNRKVYALEEMGQQHYYFQSQNLVVWLAVDPAFADEALQQIWRSTHEKVTYVDDDSVLLNSRRWTGSRVSLPNSIKQSSVLWHDVVMPNFPSAPDEIYGA